MRARITLITLSLTLSADAACGGSEEQPSGTLLLANPRPGVTPVLRGSLQSACKQHGAEADGFAGALSASLQPDGTLTVIHLDVEANCAATIVSKATVTLPAGGAAGAIAIEEWVTNPEAAADCSCRFDVTTSLAGLAPGSYSVTARGPSGELAGPTLVSIPAPLASQQSACKGGLANGPLGPTLTASAQGSSVVVEHLDVEANCAATIESRATVTPPAGGKGGTIAIAQVITNPEVSANCVCRFDLKATVTGLVPGSYTVTTTGPAAGELAGPITVVVP